MYNSPGMWIGESLGVSEVQARKECSKSGQVVRRSCPKKSQSRAALQNFPAAEVGFGGAPLPLWPGAPRRGVQRHPTTIVGGSRPPAVGPALGASTSQMGPPLGQHSLFKGPAELAPAL